MIVRNKKPFAIGMALALSFFGVLALIFSPVFGDGKNGLVYSDDMFKNDGAKVSARYGVDEKEVMTSWWNVLKSMDKELKKQGKIEEAKIVSDVMKKAVEPA